MIFVFGSNLAGRHGKGAALTALRDHGAKYGEGVGRTGQAYAIPTKDENLRVMSIDKIRPYVNNFISYARTHPHLEFNVTRVGCGLSGYKDAQMAPLFFGAPKNCMFDPVWEEIIRGDLK